MNTVAICLILGAFVGHGAGVSEPWSTPDPTEDIVVQPLEEVMVMVTRSDQKILKLLTDLCHSRQSCQGKCGHYLKQDFESSAACSCDQLCPVFDDCCWDFYQQCPEEAAKTSAEFPYLKNATHTCNFGNMFISGCHGQPDHNVLTDDDVLTDKSSISAPAVKDMVANVDYTTATAFTECTNESKTYPVVEWNKMYTTSGAFNVEEFVNFLLTGIGSLRFRKKLVDVPPPGLQTRQCQPISDVYCYSLPTESSLGSEIYFTVRNLSAVCDIMAEENLFIFNEVEPTPLPASHVQEDVESYDDCRVFNNLVFGSKAPMLFSALVTLKEERSIVNLSPEYVSVSFQSAWCEMNNSSSSSDTCIPRVRCALGYFYYQMDCRLPIFLMINVVLQNTSLHYLTAAEEAVDEGLSVFGHDLWLEKMMEKRYVNRHGDAVYDVSYLVHSQSFQDQGGLLPPTEAIMNRYVDLLDTPFYPDQTIVCFEFEPAGILPLASTASGRWLSQRCDKMLKPVQPKPDEEDESTCLGDQRCAQLSNSGVSNAYVVRCITVISIVTWGLYGMVKYHY